MPKLRIGSLPSGNSNHISALRPTSRARVAKTIMERDFPRFERIRRIYSCDRSTLVSLKRGFGEYYQCGYWAALENRGSRLLAAARGSSPLLSAGLRDPRDIKTCLTRAWFLTDRSSDGTLKVVLKRGTALVFQGGLTSRLSFLPDILLRGLYHA
ncbi:MAG: hypothetical protein DMG77_18170 [Acidobacteria bacterium]|nr:MAG: hypothetical protein DMG77_18170 [Acidobacteriota bacterium]